MEKFRFEINSLLLSGFLFSLCSVVPFSVFVGGQWNDTLYILKLLVCTCHRWGSLIDQIKMIYVSFLKL